MNENSPICARLAEIVSAVRSGCRKASTIPNAATDLPTTMMSDHQRARWSGLLDEDGRDRTASRPRRRRAPRRRPGAAARRRAARWLRSDSLITTPAKNAPSANDTPKSADDADRDAERERQHGQREELARARAADPFEEPREARGGPRRASAATNSRDLAERQRERRREAALSAGAARRAGRRAPGAAPGPGPSRGPRRSASRRRCGRRPSRDGPRSSSARRSTTVLATERARPKTSPAPERPAPERRDPTRRAPSPPRSGPPRRAARSCARPADRAARSACRRRT